MEVILVDEHDRPIGAMEKIEVHQKALLHRAFSIFIINDKEEMLLHKRSDLKYHSAGLWTNACCSHPRPGQETQQAAEARLNEEMGIMIPLKKIFDFTYNVKLENGLTEHEFDHVFLGYYSGNVYPDPIEVSEFCFKPIREIEQSLNDFPADYTVWFKISFPEVVRYLKINKIT